MLIGDPPDRAANLNVAILNYAGVLALLNAEEQAASLKSYVKSGVRLNLNRKDFSVTEFRGAEFLTPLSGRPHYGYALWAPVFDHLIEITNTPITKAEGVVSLPVPPNELLIPGGDGGAVLPDGLAVLPREMSLTNPGPGGMPPERPNRYRNYNDSMLAVSQNSTQPSQEKLYQAR